LILCDIVLLCEYQKFVFFRITTIHIFQLENVVRNLCCSFEAKLFWKPSCFMGKAFWKQVAINEVVCKEFLWL